MDMSNPDEIFRETRKRFSKLNLRDKFLCLAKLRHGDLDYESIANDMGLTREQALKIATMSIKRLCIKRKISKATRSDLLKYGEDENG